MSSFLHKHELFNDSGCLSQEALEHYLEHLLTDENRKLVDDHLASCLLCKEALEGISELNNDQHEPMISEESEGISFSAASMDESSSYAPRLGTYTNRVNMRLRSRFGYDPSRRRPVRRDPYLRNLFIPAAASIIVLMGIIAYFHYFFPERQDLAMSDKKEIPLMTEEKETAGESLETSVTPPETEQLMVGGVMDKSEETVEEDIIPAASGNNQPTEDITEVAVVENEEMPDEEIIIAEDDEDITIAEAVAEDEVVSVYAAEEMAGAGLPDEQALVAKSRSKGSQKKAEQAVVFNVVEQMPEFPGGIDSMNYFLRKNLLYPMSTEQQTDTTVIAQFIVSKKGKIKDVEIVQSAGKVFDDEVVRVIKLMPDWNPGIQRGKTVSVKYFLPIQFKTE